MWAKVLRAPIGGGRPYARVLRAKCYECTAGTSEMNQERPLRIGSEYRRSFVFRKETQTRAATGQI
jgi:hypothetical protein